LKGTTYCTKLLVVPEIMVLVDKKTEGFKRRIIINWGDGAESIVRENEINLRGKDGNLYEVPIGSEHGIICREILKENGYSTK